MVNFKNLGWDKITKINYLQRAILIYSFLYYEKSISIVSDKYFDSCCKQLVKGQNKNKDILKQTEYYKIFKDFDGTTGYYLFDKLDKKDKKYIKLICRTVYRNFKKSGGNILL